jgi:hypothetical protein
MRMTPSPVAEARSGRRRLSRPPLASVTVSGAPSRERPAVPEVSRLSR